MITIQQAQNGYLYTNEYANDNKEVSVYQDDDHCDDEHDLDNLMSLLYKIIEDLGCIGSKHDKRRIRVEIVNQQEG